MLWTLCFFQERKNHQLNVSNNCSKILIIAFTHSALLAVLTMSELVILDTSTEEKIGYGLMRSVCVL